MGIFKGISDAVGGTLADQWKDIITAGNFSEHTVVVPGVLQKTNNGRGANLFGSDGIISNGSKIFVPENTVAFIFSESSIENIITEPGSFEYQDGQTSIFNDKEFNGSSLFNQMIDRGTSVLKQSAERVGFGGQSAVQKRIAFVNMREIRGIKFGTHGPLVYNDLFYGVDLEIMAFGSFSIKITNPITFIRNFVPANVAYLSFDDKDSKAQISSEFIQSFTVAVNSLSENFRISQLPSHASEISKKISTDADNAGTWPERFGFEVTKVAIENIEFSDDARELVKQFSSNKMNVKAFDDISQRTSNIAAQQKIAEGIQDNGLGNGAGMIFGMNMSQNMNGQAQTLSTPTLSIDQQIETLKKLKDLVDLGILSEEEFNNKKKEIMGL
ncbi:SPFH domain-containing protein [Lactococcus protaetiae]|uniref:SPFH domain-containing protein n=1 Tax=Lactococcus protaetiae TaxID=2592653 RepID=A0A514Z6G0_9LACT|nr:SPFH domain-containing protein [Lactococcus protaetiae]MCL2114059.1 SPFH domain-containing protein [Streptococcaceae bacterium]QDK70195.1 SPFH domain-containing protein [Lactococcus protaetiae]